MEVFHVEDELNLITHLEAGARVLDERAVGGADTDHDQVDGLLRRDQALAHRLGHSLDSSVEPVTVAVHCHLLHALGHGPLRQQRADLGGGRDGIRAPGVVDGEIATIKALAAGTLERLLVAEGQAVKKGQRLAELDRDKVRNALEELALGEREIANSEARALEKRPLLAANQGYWQKQVQRFERLKENRSVSGDQLERSRLQLREAQTALLALVIFHAQWVWNLLLWPLIVMSDPDMRGLPQGIAGMPVGLPGLPGRAQGPRYARVTPVVE